MHYGEFSTYFKTFYGQFQVIFGQIRPILRSLWTISSEFKAFFSLRGEIWYTPSERREERRKRKRDLVLAAHRDITLMAKGKGMDIPVIIWWADKAQSDQRGGHRQRPSPDKHRPSPGRQRPSPTRVPTRTSRRAGIGQGDLPHTREATSTLRMQGDHKEQHLSQSLNR